MTRWLSSVSFRLAWFLFAAVIIYSGCHHATQDRILISGQIQGAEDMMYLMEQQPFELVMVDSVVPAGNGTFQWAVNAGETSIYLLIPSPGERLVFIARPGDSIRITGEMGRPSSGFRVTGNEESTILQSFYAYSAGNLEEVDSLQQVIDKRQGDPDFYEVTVMADSLFNQIWERQRVFEKAFIREHAGAFSTLLVVNYHFGVRPVLAPSSDPEDYRRVDSGLMANYPENKHTLYFHKWLKEVR